VGFSLTYRQLKNFVKGTEETEDMGPGSCLSLTDGVALGKLLPFSLRKYRVRFPPGVTFVNYKVLLSGRWRGELAFQPRIP
jgi:hypothetical protein